MQLDHRPVEAERTLVREALRDDLILGSQPTIEVREVGIGDDKVHIGMRPRRFQPQEFAAPPTDQRNLEARSLDQSESAYRPVATVVHTPSVGQRCRADLPLGARRSALVISLALRAWSGRSALQEIGTWALVVTSKHHASLCFRAAHLQHRGWLRVRGLCGIVRFNHSGERSIVDDISTGSGVAGGSDLCTDCCRRHRYVGEPAEHHRRHRVIVDTRPLDVHDRCADDHDSASSAGGAVDRSDRRGR